MKKRKKNHSYIIGLQPVNAYSAVPPLESQINIHL